MLHANPQMEWAASRVWARELNAIDPQYLANRRGMNAGAGQLRYRFTYHWLEPGRPVADQVARVWYCMQGFITQGEGVMLDAEEKGVTAEMAVAFCQQMEVLTGRPCAVYTGLASLIGSAGLFDGRRPLIFPHYTTNMAESRQLAKQRGARYLDAIQWSSTGHVAGVSTAIDLDQVEVTDRFERCCGW